MSQPTRELQWYQHTQGGGVHGFDAESIAQAQHAYTLVQDAKAQGLPAPVVPRHPLDEIVGQIRTGKLIPCAAPAGVRTLELSPERIEQLEAADRVESVAEKRARLLAELAELGDEGGDGDVSSPGVGVAGTAPGDDTKPRRGGRVGASR